MNLYAQNQVSYEYSKIKKDSHVNLNEVFSRAFNNLDFEKDNPHQLICYLVFKVVMLENQLKDMNERFRFK